MHKHRWRFVAAGEAWNGGTLYAFVCNEPTDHGHNRCGMLAQIRKIDLWGKAPERWVRIVG